MNRLDPRTGRFENLRTADGLPSDVLRGILEDEDGMLWIASNQGLARLDPRTRKIRIFDENDGLPGRQFTSNARLRLRSGELLFGTTQGFVRFDPGALQPNTDPPPVVLTGFEVFNQPMLPGLPGSPLRQSITETRRLEIPARLSVLGFQFAALNYRSSARNQYRFMLEGFDEDWRKPGPERRATYTNLDPGRYRLRVKAANSDGVWNEAGVEPGADRRAALVADLVVPGRGGAGVAGRSGHDGLGHLGAAVPRAAARGGTRTAGGRGARAGGSRAARERAEVSRAGGARQQHHPALDARRADHLPQRVRPAVLRLLGSRDLRPPRDRHHRPRDRERRPRPAPADGRDLREPGGLRAERQREHAPQRRARLDRLDQQGRAGPAGPGGRDPERRHGHHGAQAGGGGAPGS